MLRVGGQGMKYSIALILAAIHHMRTFINGRHVQVVFIFFCSSFFKRNEMFLFSLFIISAC